MKILVIFTGGTIGSTLSANKISPDSANSHALISSHNNIYNDSFEAMHPYTILSENLNGTHLSELYACLSTAILRDYDGIIVTHGTDTLQYTASYLSYTFTLCTTPIVVVSANYPLANPLSNGVANFSAAVDFIHSRAGRGVFVSYQNSGESTLIHRASRVLPHSAYSDRVESIFGSYYGKITDNHFEPNPSYTEAPDSDIRLNPKLGAQSDVIYIQPYVGCSYPQVGSSAKAVLLGSYHSGTLNTTDSPLRNFCKTANASGVPIFLTGNTDGFEYESKSEFKRLGIRSLPPCSPIAMYMKLWLIDKESIFDVSQPLGGDMQG